MNTGLLVVDVTMAYLQDFHFDLHSWLWGIASRVKFNTDADVFFFYDDMEYEFPNIIEFVARPYHCQYKSDFDAFDGTNLDKMLQARGIEEVEVCGLFTEWCIDATVKSAINHGYKVCVNPDLILSENGCPETTESCSGYFPKECRLKI